MGGRRSRLQKDKCGGKIKTGIRDGSTITTSTISVTVSPTSIIRGKWTQEAKRNYVKRPRDAEAVAPKVRELRPVHTQIRSGDSFAGKLLGPFQGTMGSQGSGRWRVRT